MESVKQTIDNIINNNGADESKWNILKNSCNNK